MHIQEVEWSIIAGVMCDDKSARKILRKVRKEHFSDKVASEVYALTKELYLHNKKVDLVMLRTEAKARQVEWNISDVLEGIAPGGNLHYPTTQTDYYIAILMDDAKKRMFEPAIIKAQTLIKDISCDGVMSFLTKEMLKVKTIQDEINVVTPQPDVVNNIKANKRRLLIPSGFPNFDKKFFGFRKGQYVVIAGRPSTGKTAFCLNMMMNAMSKKNLGCAYVSLETDANTIIYRMLACKAQVDLANILKGDVTSAEEQRLEKCAEEMAGEDFYVCDTFKMDVAAIADQVKQISHYANNLSFVVIDHIGLVSGDRKRSRHEELGAVSRELKVLGRELGVVVFPLVQLNRQIESEGRSVPRLSDLRDCGDIEQDADIVLAFHNDYDKKHRTVRILKAKEGENNVAIRFSWDGPKQTFT